MSRSELLQFCSYVQDGLFYKTLHYIRRKQKQNKENNRKMENKAKKKQTTKCIK